jgi:hypothetical protein
VEALMGAAEQYLAQRPLAENVELRPFYAGKSQDDRAARWGALRCGVGCEG